MNPTKKTLHKILEGVVKQTLIKFSCMSSASNFSKLIRMSVHSAQSLHMHDSHISSYLPITDGSKSIKTDRGTYFPDPDSEKKLWKVSLS